MARIRLQKTHFLWVFLGFVLVVIGLSLVDPVIELTARHPDRPDYQFESIGVSIWNGPLLEWTINAQDGQMNEKKQKTVLNKANVQFLENGQQKVKIVTPRMVLFQGANRMDMEDPQATFQIERSSIKMTTSVLHWNGHTQTFRSSGPVTIQTGPVTIQSNSFEASIPLRKITLSKNPHIEIQEPK